MRSSPYRRSLEAELPKEPWPSPDADLVAIFGLLWIMSVLRVGLAIAHHESSDTEPALAAIAIVLLPYLLRDTLGSYFMR